MSLSATRLGRTTNVILGLQGQTLQAAIEAAQDCRCDTCGGREGEVINQSHWDYTSFVTVNGQEYDHNRNDWDFYRRLARVQVRREWVETLRRVQNLAYHEDGTLMCQDCEGGNYHCCERCNERVPFGQITCNRCSSGYFCQCGAEVLEQGESCSLCLEQEQRDLIRRYSYRPDPLFIGKGPLYLGVELEVLADIKAARTLQKVASYRAYLKTDSSIIGHGFEIVTHPMSLEKQLDFWEEVIEEVGQDLTPHSSCGMHVHLSREPLSQLQIGKILVFLNNPDNTSWIDLLAGRQQNHYCRKELKSIEDALNPRTRYEALNLMNEKTIEFRLFASSNKLEELSSRIEFCHALTFFCEQCALDSLDWDSFMEWLYIASPKESYHYLKEWVETTPEPPDPKDI